MNSEITLRPSGALKLLIFPLLGFAATTASAATWTVCPAGCDSNSIQGAIQSAAAGDVIELLASAPYIEPDIIVNQSVVIQGLADMGGGTIRAAATRGTAASRVLSVLPGVFLELRDLTIEFGNDEDGGGIHNQGNLLLTRTQLHANDADQDGGGLFNDLGASAVIRDSELVDNTAVSLGGAVFNEGYLRVEDSRMSANETDSYGGAVFSRIGGLSLNRVVVANNVAGFGGGGVAVNGGVMSIEDSEIRFNDAVIGGGLVLVGPLIEARLLRTTVRANTASTGGGAFVRGDVSPEFVNSTFLYNQAKSDGGAIYLYGEKRLSLSSVTIARNVANSDASAGGNGGGIHIGDECSGSICLLAKATLRNTLVGSNQRRTDGSGSPVPQDCYGDLDSAGYNLVGTGATSPLADCDVEGNLAGVLLGVDAGFGDAGMHGGVVLPNGESPYTQALLASSPAVSHGHPGGCRDSGGALLGTDQRYAPRVGSCEIGAFEFNGTPMPLRRRRERDEDHRGRRRHS
jgi:hypothetical protein